MTVRCAIMGSGNIGTDLMIKLRRSETLELVALVGIDADSDGLGRANALGISAPHTGIDWVRDHAAEIDLIFDATSASVHMRNAGVLADLGIAVIDLTPAARGPKVVPTVNLGEHLAAPNVNMITCGGQATVPIVAAVSRAATVPYAEMVSTVASRSAGPGTRQNDEFTGRRPGARGDRARIEGIIVLNPADLRSGCATRCAARCPRAVTTTPCWPRSSRWWPTSRATYPGTG
jgi:acetaldehyde dehydrogenase